MSERWYTTKLGYRLPEDNSGRYWEVTIEYNGPDARITEIVEKRYEQRATPNGKSSLAKKAASYVKAEASQIVHGKVPDEVFDHRLRLCRGCEHLKETDKGLFCSGCECPAWSRSELRTKLRMPAVECPIGKWGKYMPQGAKTA